MVNIGFQVLFVSALIQSVLIYLLFYFIYPLLDIDFSTLPPHVAFFSFSVLGWVSGFFAVLLFYTYAKGFRPSPSR